MPVQSKFKFEEHKYLIEQMKINAPSVYRPIAIKRINSLENTLTSLREAYKNNKDILARENILKEVAEIKSLIELYKL